MKVFLLYPYFLSPDGTEKMIGGVETYIESLSKVISTMGFTPIICQFSSKDFETTYLGCTVLGYNVKTIKNLYKRISNQVNKTSDLIIFVSDLWAIRLNDVKTLSIQHGVYWDVPRNKGPYILYYIQRIKQIFNALIDFNKTKYSVCVDYNFYNWYKTINVKSKSKKHWIIPNFAEKFLDKNDMEVKLQRINKDINIIFARRFYEFRGLNIFIESMTKILREYKNVNVTFAGEGPGESYINQSLSSFGDRVSIIKYLPNESFDIHKKFDIAVVPTTGSEGTSLSLLEAMGAGCIVVSTPVGGLSNIVIDGFNGYLTMPNSEDLYSTIKKAIDNIDNKTIVTNAVNCVKLSFSFEKWSADWKKVLQNILTE